MVTTSSSSFSAAGSRPQPEGAVRTGARRAGPPRATPPGPGRERQCEKLADTGGLWSSVETVSSQVIVKRHFSDSWDSKELLSAWHFAAGASKAIRRSAVFVFNLPRAQAVWIVERSRPTKDCSPCQQSPLLGHCSSGGGKTHPAVPFSHVLSLAKPAKT